MGELAVEEKIKLMQGVGEEIVTEEELRELFESGEEIIAYDGFEPSGQLHIGSGLLRAINVNKAIQTGMRFKMFVADWHAWANHKLGGDLEKIQTVGEYFIEVWRATGMDLERVEFIWASDLIKEEGYWEKVMQIAIEANLPRVVRTLPTLGRTENESISSSFILYAVMQAADIFQMDVKVAQMGVDQRNTNMLAREVGPKLGYWAPVVISNHMLLGLTPPKEDRVPKMSKSIPDSAIWMTDSRDEIERKIMAAWAPEGQAEQNPVLELCRYIIFEKVEKMVIERAQEHGGDIEYTMYKNLENDYVSKKLHPMDLKKAVAGYIDEFIGPVRQHFKEDGRARELKEQVRVLR